MLITGRGSVCQWHTDTRTSKPEKLRKISPHELYVEINPEDAKTAGINSEEYVWVMSRCGSVRALADVNNSVSKGQVFMPMHYAHTNELTPSVFDPISREPAYKLSAVQVIHETIFMKLFAPHVEGTEYHNDGCGNKECINCVQAYKPEIK